MRVTFENIENTLSNFVYVGSIRVLVVGMFVILEALIMEILHLGGDFEEIFLCR
jgi:hypothetical protein